MSMTMMLYLSGIYALIYTSSFRDDMTLCIKWLLWSQFYINMQSETWIVNMSYIFFFCIKKGRIIIIKLNSYPFCRKIWRNFSFDVRCVRFIWHFYCPYLTLSLKWASFMYLRNKYKRKSSIKILLFTI